MQFLLFTITAEIAKGTESGLSFPLYTILKYVNIYCKIVTSTRYKLLLFTGKKTYLTIWGFIKALALGICSWIILRHQRLVENLLNFNFCVTVAWKLGFPRPKFLYKKLFLSPISYTITKKSKRDFCSTKVIKDLKAPMEFCLGSSVNVSSLGYLAMGFL